MHHLTSRLLLYSDLPSDAILSRLAAIHAELEAGTEGLEALRRRALTECKRLLDLATAYGFDGNLWQNYLTWLLMSYENSFSLTCERAIPGEGSIHALASADFEIFRQLMHFDFGVMERALGLTCFSAITDYRAIPKREQMFNRAVSEEVRALSPKLAAAENGEEMFHLVTAFFTAHGVGLFGMNRAFRLREEDGVTLDPIHNLDAVRLSDLVGYELQKARLRANVEAFLSGRPFNNMLLYGDAGTGKSTSVKALLNEYGDRGLRVVELNKHQFDQLSSVIARVKTRHYRFILFLDDLSFDEGEVEYKYLKAVIEGGLETRPDNVMICATSNRRHLVRETWKDRSDMEHDGDIHRSDTMEEKLSLAARFGCSINYSTPDRRLWNDIVRTLAARHPEITLSEEELLAAAQRFELRHGGISGRCAQQFINEIAGSAQP